MKAEIARMVSYFFTGLFFVACLCKGIDPERITAFSKIPWEFIGIFMVVAVIGAICYENFREQTLKTIKSGQKAIYWPRPSNPKGLT